MSTIRFDSGGRQGRRDGRAWVAIEHRGPDDDGTHRRACDEAAARPAARAARMTSGGRPPPGALPALHAALDYRARALGAALEAASGAGGGHPLLARFAPSTAALLRWWCSDPCVRSRVDNFNHVQRQALMHLVLAHEELRGDDPTLCGPQVRDAGPAGAAAPAADTAVYRLRLAPGSGLRWVLQAVLVWRWAQAHAEGRSDALRLDLVAATPALAARLQRAVVGDDGDPATASVLRHARLFLPPGLRAPFRSWLAPALARGLLRVRTAAAGEDPPPGPWRLIAASDRDPEPRDDPRLQVDLLLAAPARETVAPRDGMAIVEAPLSRAIARGACKLPVLEAVTAVGTLRTRAPRRVGLRPRLSRTQQRLLAGGLAALRQREAAFAALDPARRPRMAVLCATPALQRAARRWLLRQGVDSAALATDIDASVGGDAAVVLDRLPPCAVTSDPRICVVVALRALRERDGAAASSVAWSIAATGAALLWPEPDFAELRTENLERVSTGRSPAHLLDALGVFDDPRCHGDHAGLPHAIARTAALPATDDLFLAPLHEDPARFDIAVPARCDDDAADARPDTRPDPSERLRDLPRRILRRRQALAVARSTHTHAPCGRHDSGLRRAFLECAEADPAIEAHALPDPRRHGVRLREALLAHGGARGWPDALVRTAERVYLVEFLPFCPTPAAADDPQARLLRRWLRRAEAQPATDGGGRRWCRVALPVPMFWSWKRGGHPLTALLATLAEGARPGRDERRASTC